MSFEVFTADTFSGKFRIAVKTRKDTIPGDNRTDAYTIALAQFGRSVRLTQQSAKVRKLTEDYSPVGEWAFMARGK